MGARRTAGGGGGPLSWGPRPQGWVPLGRRSCVNRGMPDLFLRSGAFNRPITGQRFVGACCFHPLFWAGRRRCGARIVLRACRRPLLGRSRPIWLGPWVWASASQTNWCRWSSCALRGLGVVVLDVTGASRLEGRGVCAEWRRGRTKFHGPKHRWRERISVRGCELLRRRIFAWILARIWWRQGR